MAVGFPPQPVYPDGIDSDRTLYLVYNTTEAALAEDNEPWGEEVAIVPRGKTQSEIWADNGFANINGELFYYDSVSKDANGKVNRLKRCARNLGGTTTQFNNAGTMVRGFVVAEHHNQLVDCIILVEKFLGADLSTDKESIDWRVRQLRNVPIIFDDFGCPDFTFFFEIKESNPSSGTVVHYKLDITGSFSEFTLSFGDGTSTSSIQEDDHTYPPNAKIDPVVTLKNDRCQMVQTPASRDGVDAPEAQDSTVSFSSPNFSDFTFPNITVSAPEFPDPNLTMPPFQFPCVDFSSFGVSTSQIPSVIIFSPPINLPSVIDFDSINIPSFINIPNVTLPSVIDIIAPNISVVIANIPNISLVVPNISIPTPSFPQISFNVPTLPNISLIVPAFPNISVNASNLSLTFTNTPNLSVTSWATPPTLAVSWTAPPAVGINWGTPPSISVTYTPLPTINMAWGTPPAVSMVWGTPPAVSMAWGTVPSLTVNWGNPPTIQVNVAVTCPSTPLALAATDPVGMTDEMLGVGRDLEVKYDISGFPSEIRLIPPEIPDVKIVHDIPSEIFIRTPTFPDLKFAVPELRDIRILPPEKKLTIETIGIPEVLKLESAFKIPEKIELVTELKIPEKIVIENTLPDIIRVEHDLPKMIELKMPEKPEIELVYKGSPIPVQIQLDFQKLVGDQENFPCVALVPCKR